MHLSLLILIYKGIDFTCKASSLIAGPTFQSKQKAPRNIGNFLQTFPSLLTLIYKVTTAPGNESPSGTYYKPEDYVRIHNLVLACRL